jgi:hypothetical protein
MLVCPANSAQTRRCFIKTIRAGLAVNFAFNLVLAHSDGAPDGPMPPLPMLLTRLPDPRSSFVTT